MTHKYLEKPGGVYDIVLPVLSPEKTKWWEYVHLNWHRTEGPAIIRPELDIVEWMYKGNRMDVEVMDWCLRNNADPLDLSEHEILVMWNEIL